MNPCGKIATLLFAGLLMVGCASSPPEQKELVVLLPDADGSVGAVEVRTEGGTSVLDRAHQATTLKGKKKPPAKPTFMEEAQINETFKEAIRARPRFAPEAFILYFDTGKATLTDKSEKQIGKILQAVNKRAEFEISVVGHTDAVGSEEYNLKLSLERAETVHAKLISSGIEASAMEISSHGEANPLVPTKDSVAEPRNRRVEVTVR